MKCHPVSWNGTFYVIGELTVICGVLVSQVKKHEPGAFNHSPFDLSLSVLGNVPAKTNSPNTAE